MKCIRCGNEINQWSMYCPYCGATVSVQQTQQQMYANNAYRAANFITDPALGQGTFSDKSGVNKKKGKKVAVISTFIALGIVLVALIVALVFKLTSDPETKQTGAGASSGDDDPIEGGNVSGGVDENSDIDHTVMIYMIGSDLESNGRLASMDIREIMRATYGENIRVVIQTGGAKKWWTEGIEDGKVQRFEVKTDELVELDNLGKLNMADKDTLADFIGFAVSEYAAKNYTLVLWNHGGGIPIGYGQDEVYSGEILTDSDIGEVMEAVDVQFESVLMDACNMCTLEVALAIKDYSNYMIAAESYTVGTGMDYEVWLNYMNENPEASGADYGRVLVDAYIESVEGIDDTVTFSTIDLSKVDKVQEEYEEYIGYVYEDLEEGAFVEYTMARSECGFFQGSDTVDIVNLAKKYKAENSYDLIKAVDEAVTYTDSECIYANGLGVYSPIQYIQYYNEGRESLDEVGYSDEALQFYDSYMSLCYAYLGKEYVQAYAGNWYDEDIVDLYSAETSVSTIETLATTTVGGNTVIPLTAADWDIVSEVEVEVAVFLNDTYVMVIGSDYYTNIDSAGNIILDIPQNWTYINGQLASFVSIDTYTDAETGQWLERGAVFATVNGEEILMLVQYDSDYPSGRVIGYIYCDFETLSIGEDGDRVLYFESDDVIELMYPVINGSTGEITYESGGLGTFTASGMVVSYEPIDYGNYNVYCSYEVTDVYGNVYETEDFIY